ncbi:MAG: matrixin family metalloprotease [Amphiplicatus sp.]
MPFRLLRIRFAPLLFVSTLFGAFTIATGLTAGAESDYRLLRLDDRPVKWGGPEFGVGAEITYAFLTTETSFDNARNCRRMTPAPPVVAASGIDEATLAVETAAAFALWEAAANVAFRKIDDPAAANILIGADDAPRGSAHADVLAGPEDGPVGVISRGLVCLSTKQAWKIGFGADPKAQDLRYTLAHEIGHALGLDHPGPHGALMSFTYREDFSGLQPGDVAGAEVLYGPARRTVASRGD